MWVNSHATFIDKAKSNSNQEKHILNKKPSTSTMSTNKPGPARQKTTKKTKPNKTC
jgi:hypothetical protein